VHLAGSQDLPFARDVRLDLTGSSLPGLFIVELTPAGKVRFRLSGSRIGEILGWSPNGPKLSNATPIGQLALRTDRIRNMASQPCGSLWQTKIVRRSGQITPLCGIGLPVRPNSPGEPMRIYQAIDVQPGAKWGKSDDVELWPLAHEFA
jgi:hypothetical protein